jgi:hypothetical protein
VTLELNPARVDVGSARLVDGGQAEAVGDGVVIMDAVTDRPVQVTFDPG